MTSLNTSSAHFHVAIMKQSFPILFKYLTLQHTLLCIQYTRNISSKSFLISEANASEFKQQSLSCQYPISREKVAIIFAISRTSSHIIKTMNYVLSYHYTYFYYFIFKRFLTKQKKKRMTVKCLHIVNTVIYSSSTNYYQ